MVSRASWRSSSLAPTSLESDCVWLLSSFSCVSYIWIAKKGVCIQYRTPNNIKKQEHHSRLDFLCENGCVLHKRQYNDSRISYFAENVIALCSQLTAIVWPCSSVFLVSSSLTLISSFTMFSWPTLRPAPFSTSLLRLEISSLSWLMVSFARTAPGYVDVLVLVFIKFALVTATGMSICIRTSSCGALRDLITTG